MSELLQTSLIWRVCAAIAAWYRKTPLKKAERAFVRLWMQSGFYRFFARLLTSAPITERSNYRRLLGRCNDRLGRHGSFPELLRTSLLGRVYAKVLACLQNSFLVGRMFAGGMTSILLCIIAAYFPIDWLLRDILKLSALSSIWDEALMLLCLLWIVYRRTAARPSLRTASNPVDLWLGLYMLVGLVLLVFTESRLSVNITGYRASMQYILLFFLVTRLLQNDRDFTVMYRLSVFIALAFALHGIAQFVLGVEIPASWTDAAEGSVRTRAFSVFSNPNIFAGYMVLFAPMAIGAAYSSRDPATKVVFWICGLCMCLACLFTMSRGAWLALACAAVLFAMIVDRRLLLLMLVGGAASCLLPFVRSRIGYLFTPQFSASNARGGRAKRWATALGYLDLLDAWPCGLGFGMFGGAVAANNPINPLFQYMYVDNYYVKTLTENGIIGLSTLCASMLGLVWNGLKACARAERDTYKPLCAGMLAGLVGILVQSFFESLWEEPYMMALFFAVAGMLVYAGLLRKPTGETAR